MQCTRFLLYKKQSLCQWLFLKYWLRLHKKLKLNKQKMKFGNNFINLQALTILSFFIWLSAIIKIYCLYFGVVMTKHAKKWFGHEMDEKFVMTHDFVRGVMAHFHDIICHQHYSWWLYINWTLADFASFIREYQWNKGLVIK